MIKPRFLFVLPSLRAGGAEKVVIRIANDLVSHGEVVALAVVDCVGELRGDLDQNIVVHDLGIQKTRYAFFALVRLIRRLSPELIFSSLTRVSLLLLMARPLLPRSTRIVVRQPGIASIDLKHLEPRWLYQLLFVRLMPRADLIVTQSGPMTTDLASILATRVGRVVEIPNPSPTVDRRSYLDAGTPFSGATNFLAVGRLSSEKGYDTLLAAFSIVAARRDDARLTIIGDGPLAAELQDLCARLGITAKVSFLGFVADPFPYYVHADAVVLASRWEGFPNVLIEAIASGTPVVATACGGVTAEIVDQDRNGIVVSADGPQPMARAMLQVLGLGRDEAAAPRKVDRFAPERVLAEYRRQLLGRTSAP